MRIVVLGDYHLKEDELDWTAQCMDDIRACAPDLVVPLGDFGSNRLIGSPEGLLQSHALLTRIGAPMRAILGNHDLQRESGGKGQAHGTMERELVRLFGQSSGYGVMEESDFRLFFVSTDPQPSDSCYSVQECYVSEEQFDWLSQKLQERRGVPVIMFTHAPPIGCGLRTVPGVHVRATNAYLDQNHDAMRWYELIRHTPEIVLWFSAHYHLGHAYPDSCTTRLGTTFFTTGVHGSATRDGERLSRVIDITEHGVRVATLDHRKRSLLPDADWSFNGTPGSLISRKSKALTTPETASFPQEAPLSCVAACPLGDGEPLAQGIAQIGEDRWLVAASDGYLWEACVSAEAVLGTLHIGSPVGHVAVHRDEAAYMADNRLYRVHIHDLWRFARDNPDKRNRPFLEFENDLASIDYDVNGRMWAASGCTLYAVDADADGTDRFQQKRCVYTFPDAIVRLQASGGKLSVHTRNGVLYRWEEGRIGILEERVRAWDTDGEDRAVLKEHNDGYDLLYQRGEISAKLSLPLPYGGMADAAQIVCLGRGYAMLLIAGVASLWDAAANIRHVIDASSEVRTIAKGHVDPAGKLHFALAAAARGPHIRPQLQLWQYG
ncbi:3',5'-cyclic adenosine monophosphate phosphodiesterase CpdA [Paenibacillus solanacearum]|uniref:3',5'-cyclic adenosine monophosphate phosphodiesterase CpdA n=1 Tax=Paenibacillus solanacearum TaxID=2048548 RepID=A0A916JSL0_9BACL|nr:metallophosphoesterase [Paenibacillus solanacearum]CAG7600267.1 3',5'-cyclic adenosine monophosphate phosphodiesterase CpdA [Paenibacillus solanacearum]